MNNHDIAELLVRGIQAGKEVPQILLEHDISVDYKSVDGTSIAEIVLSPSLQSIPSSSELEKILLGLLSISPSLGISSEKEFICVISGLFTVLDSRILLSKIVNSLIESKIYEPNVVIEGELLLAYLAARRDRIRDRYDSITRSVLLDPRIDALAVASDGETIGEKLFNLDVRLFLDLTRIEPRAADFRVHGEVSRLSGIVKKLRESGGKPKDIIPSLDIIPGVLFDESYELGTMRFFAFIAPAIEGDFSIIPVAFNKLVEFNIKEHFVSGLIKYFIFCKDTVGINTSYKTALVDVINIESISNIKHMLQDLDAKDISKKNMLRKFIDLVNFCVTDLDVLSVQNRLEMIALIEEQIYELDAYILDDETSTKQLSLLLRLKGYSYLIGKLEGGYSGDAALYIKNMIMYKMRYSHSEAEKYLKDIRFGLCRAAFFSKLFREQEHSGSILMYKQLLLEYSQSEGVLILTGWKGHAISLWIKGDYLFRCNGGVCAFDSAIEVYKISKIDSLTPELVGELYKNRAREENKILLQQELHNILGLKLLIKYRGAFQRVANCSLHSVLLGILSIAASSVGDEITPDSFNVAEANISKLIFELKIIGIRVQISRNIEHARVLISHGISMTYGSKAQKDQDLYQEIVDKNLLPLDEIMLIHQIYSHFLLQKTGASGEISEYEAFLSKLGFYPFISSKMLGDNSIVLLKILSLEDGCSNVYDEEILEFHRCVKDFTLLHVAVIANNKQLINRLIGLFPELLEQKDINNTTPIGYIRDLEAFRLLISYGALVNWSISPKETILARILTWADYELVQEVLTAGAVVLPQLLISSSANPDPRIQRLLLDAMGPVKDIASIDGRTALHSAAIKGSSEHLDNLLAVDSVRALQVDVNGVTPLWFAVMSKRFDMAISLCRHPQVTVFNPYRGDDFSELVFSISEDQEQLDLIARMRQEKIENLYYFRDNFMQRESFASIRESARRAPIEWLVLAISERDLRAFKGALLHYPALNISRYSSTFASTALHRALEINVSVEFMRILLSLPGIDLSCTNGAGESLAQVAAMHDNVEVLSILHRLGAPMNRPDTIGITPLMDAVDRGCVNAVRYLLSIIDLDSNYRGYMGKNALDIAKSTRNYEIEIHRMLEEKSCYERHFPLGCSSGHSSKRIRRRC